MDWREGLGATSDTRGEMWLRGRVLCSPEITMLLRNLGLRFTSLPTFRFPWPPDLVSGAVSAGVYRGPVAEIQGDFMIKTERRLWIEVDGEIHLNGRRPERDDLKDLVLTRVAGYNVFRVKSSAFKRGAETEIIGVLLPLIERSARPAGGAEAVRYGYD